MDKEKVMAWLDKQIEANKIINEALSENIYRIDNPCKKIIGDKYIETIHLYGVEEVAKIIGAELIEEERVDEDYPVEKYFMYKGYAVFDLFEKENL